MTSKHTPGILRCIDNAVAAFPEEQSIILLGDYVYHFTYDRKALLALFKKIISLAQQQKEVYLLAGNHDRIQDHFVYAEAQQAFELFGDEFQRIFFVTQPCQKNIEGVDCLLFPYYFPSSGPSHSSLLPQFQDTTNPQQQLSRKINNLLQKAVDSWANASPSEKLLIIHHWYIADKKFPGQQATFSYANGALMPTFLDDPRLRFVSGHLHEAFSESRYLCTGSMRHTSPLEINQQKYCFRLDVASRQMTAYPLTYNPYFSIIEPQTQFAIIDLERLAEEIEKKMREQLTNSARSIQVTPSPPPTLQNATLTVQSVDSSFETIASYLSPELHTQLKEVKYKSILRASNILFNELDAASLHLTDRFSDRKVLLTRFLTQKYGSQSAEYLGVLEELKIL